MEDDTIRAYETGPGPIEVAVSVSSYLRTLNDALGAYVGIVQGEVSELRTYAFGTYFTIKDTTGAEGVLNCFIPVGKLRMYGHLVTSGAEIRVGGEPRINARKGSFSFQVEAVESVGEGTLRAAYEALKRELDAEGLFARALPIPVCARRIGVVTSRSGAVIDDFRKNLENRGYEILMHDARVEGVHAVASILKAIAWFQKHADRVDVVVVMRGGGSLEDLQAFNSEAVARAVAGLPMPVIAAIGHDRDVPIANLAADLSTSTPSIAAMQVNRSWNAADDILMRSTERLAARSMLLVRRVEERVTRAAGVMQGRLAALVALPSERLEEIQDRFRQSMTRLGDRLLAVERELAIVDPQRTLSLGYSILTGADGRAVRSVHDVPLGSPVRARLADGTITATVTDAHPES